MTIYVDDWRHRATIGRLTATWSLLTLGPDDDVAELHAFATRLGLGRSRFRTGPLSFVCYLVTETQRRKAIAAGAVSLTGQQIWRQWLTATVARRRAERTR